MNKFALTTVAALPGSGGGCVAALAPEVAKREPSKPVLEYKAYDRVPIKRVDPVMEEANRRAKEQREQEKMLKHAMNYGATREDFNPASFVVPPEWEDYCRAMDAEVRKQKRKDMQERLAGPLTTLELQQAWKEISEDAELEEYFSSRN